MWIEYKNLEEQKNVKSKDGKKVYDCWLLTGTRSGYGDDPDTPYSKRIFDNQTITVIEHGINRPGQSLLQFIQKACTPGDTLIVKSERDGNFWRWCTIEKKSSRQKPTYEPFSEEELKTMNKVTETVVVPWD